MLMQPIRDRACCTSMWPDCQDGDRLQTTRVGAKSIRGGKQGFTRRVRKRRKHAEFTSWRDFDPAPSIAKIRGALIANRCLGDECAGPDQYPGYSFGARVNQRLLYLSASMPHTVQMVSRSTAPG
jgi:hypothetical protein